MIVKKISDCYVEQLFDTEKNEFISQQCVTGYGEVLYVDESGKRVPDSVKEKVGYLPFDMKQPKEKDDNGTN